MCVCFQIFSLKPLGQRKPNLMWNLHGIGEESLFKWSRSFVVLHYCQSLGTEVFSRDLTINLSPQCRAFCRALKTEKLKVPLFPGPVGAGTTNDWCIMMEESTKHTWVNIPFVLSRHILKRLLDVKTKIS